MTTDPATASIPNLLGTGSRHYPNAPIIEAVIDLQTDFKSRPSPGDFRPLIATLQGRFPTAVELSDLQVAVNVPPGTPPAPRVDTHVGQIGWRLTDTANSRVVQIRQTGFTYSHLPKYTTWEVFSGEAKSVWQEFVRAMSPATVTRVAVRFINRIEVPKQRFEPREYFRLYPEIPIGIPDEINGMFMQLQMAQRDIGPDVTAVLNLALIPPDKPNTVPILFDIDVFAQRSFEPESPEVWSTIEQFRTRKNEIFEASITDESRRLFL